MVDTYLQLGDFVFSNLEIPESLILGGSQRIAVHDFVGGARTVQAMGSNHAPIAWQGLMLGASALDRAKYLDFLRVQGQALQLAVFDSNYTVVIEHFEFRVERFYKVQYSIGVVVVSDNAQPVSAIAPSGFDAAIGADCSLMSQLGASIGDIGLTSAIGGVVSAVGAVSSFASATTSTINGVLTAVAGVSSTVGTLTSVARNAMGAASVLGGLIPGGPIALSAANLVSQASAAVQYPILQNIGNLATRVTRNVGMANLQSSTKTLQVGGGTLFDVAAAQYGDASMWPAIAKASGLTDPSLFGLQTLNIPAVAAASGGILSQ